MHDREMNIISSALGLLLFYGSDGSITWSLWQQTSLIYSLDLLKLDEHIIYNTREAAVDVINMM